MKKPESIIVYLDRIDWEEEAGHASDGTRVYPSAEDCLKGEPCAKGCGVVEARLVFVRNKRKLRKRGARGGGKGSP